MELKVSFLNCISHGDCAVITFKEDDDLRCIVIDGGENDDSAQALREYLEQEGVEKIDLMVGTHIDSDHIEGLSQFVKQELKQQDKGEPCISITQFWGPKPSQDHMSTYGPSAVEEMHASQRFVIEGVVQNDRLYDRLQKAQVPVHHPALDDQPKNPFRSVRLEVLGPDTQISADEIKSTALGLTTRESEGTVEITSLNDLEAAITRNAEAMALQADRNANNQSIVLRLTPAAADPDSEDTWQFLFPGDAGPAAWDSMVGNKKVKPRLSAKVLKLPHHGSRNGLDDAGADQVKPTYSIVSVGQKHGIPDEDVLKMVQSRNSEILCTQRNCGTKKKSACYSVCGAKCPAKDDPKTITFTLNTDTGRCTITPAGRACQHSW